jgi:hypothetical protein
LESADTSSALARIVEIDAIADPEGVRQMVSAALPDE